MTWILWLAGAYGVWLVLLYLIQDTLIYATALTPKPPAGGPPAGYEVLKIDIGADAFVEAWFAPATIASSTPPAPTVIYFHGNAGLIDFQLDVAEKYRDLGFSVALCEFRGHGRSGGVASEKTLVADAVSFYDLIAARGDVDADRVIIHGHSLGGAIAAQLAARRPSAALILQSTFRSVPAMTRKYLAPAFLATSSLDTENAISQYEGSILLIHGRRDGVIPVSHGRRLAKAARQVTYVELPCGHNDLRTADSAAYWSTITDFTRRVIPNLP